MRNEDAGLISEQENYRRLTEFFTGLYEAEDAEAAILEALRKLAGMAGAGRGYLIREEYDGNFRVITCWNGAAAERQREFLRPGAIVPEAFTVGYRGKIRTYLLTEETAEPELRRMLDADGVRSSLLFAVRDSGRITGYTCLDFYEQVPEPEGEKDALLHNCAQVLGVFAIKRTVQQELGTAEAEKMAVLDQMQMSYYVVDAGLRLRYTNQAFLKEMKNVKQGDFCYRAILGRETPCENCPVLELKCRSRGVVSREFRPAVGSSHYLTITSPIQWDGERMYLLISQDATMLLLEHDEKARSAFLDAVMPGGMMGGFVEPGFPFYFINEAMLNYLGYESEKAFAEDNDGLITNCMHPEDREYVNREVDCQFAKGDTYHHIVYRMRKKDGSYIWVDDSGRRIVTGDGREAIVSVCLDITELMGIRRQREKANGQLRREREKINLSMEGSGIGIWEYDFEKKQLHYELEGGAGHGIYGPGMTAERNQVHPDSREALRQLVMDIMAGKPQIAGTVQLQMDPIPMRWWSFSGRTFYEGAQPKYALGVMRNVTDQILERQRYEAEIQDLTGEHGGILLSKFEADLSRDVLLDGTVYHGGEEALLGHTRYQGLLEAICRLFQLDETDAERIREFAPETLIREYELGRREKTLEYRRKLKEGGTLWVRMYVRLLRSFDSENVICYLYSYDINRQKLAERAQQVIAGSSYSFVGVINCILEDFFSLPNTSHPALADRHWEKYEQAVAAILEDRGRELFPEEELNRMEEQTTLRALQERLSVQREYTINFRLSDEQRKEERLMRAVYQYLEDQVSILVSVADVTEVTAREQARQAELQRVLEQAKEANRAKDRFLAQMSHDVRTPLTAILGMAELASQEEDLEKVRQEMETIRTSGSFLLSLINDILDVSKTDSTRLVLEQAPCSLDEFVETILAAVNPLAEKKQIAFHMAMNCGLTCIMADGRRMLQLFQNLLSNAIKYTPAGGHVDFVAELLREEEGVHWVRFVVRDDGIGMSPEFLSHAFEPFTRENDAVDEQWQGTGLGLTICKQIVETMGGTILVSSRKSYGTTFTVELPLQPLYETGERAGTEAPCGSPAGRGHESAAEYEHLPGRAKAGNYEMLTGKQILLAEDNQINREIVAALLARRGILVTEVEDGEACVEKWSASAPFTYDAVLMDIRMPHMDGLRAARLIRTASRPDAEVPILAMTANAYEADVRKSLEAGMNGHLTKPIDTKLLYDSLCRVLGEDFYDE